MPESTLTSTRHDHEEQAIVDFYQQVIHLLSASSCRFMVGGAHAFNYYTGIIRNTKDFDIFVCRDDYPLIREVMRRAGYEVELTFPHWLAKIHAGSEFVDVIFSSGNGVALVDDAWFTYAPEATVLDIQVKICPAEEMIWSKAFVMERERYDGADVAHLLQARAPRLDWDRLLQRFGNGWRVLLSHLILFGYIYPDHRALIPAHVMDRMLEQLRNDMLNPSQASQLCAGTVLSREQYLVDTEQWGYRDGRLEPFGNMTSEDIAHWTAAIPSRH